MRTLMFQLLILFLFASFAYSTTTSFYQKAFACFGLRAADDSLSVSLRSFLATLPTQNSERVVPPTLRTCTHVRAVRLPGLLCTIIMPLQDTSSFPTVLFLFS